VTNSPTPINKVIPETAIVPPSKTAQGPRAQVQVQNLKPGQKLKVTISDISTTQNRVPVTPKTSSSPTPKASAKAAVEIIPKPAKKSTAVNLLKLKPGQKIKVTIKTGEPQ
jgi:TusA-related sulfurtransferase